MHLKTVTAIALALLAFSARSAKGTAPARCKSCFQILESQSPNGPKHTPLNDVFDVGFREVNGQPLPNKELRFYNHLYNGCGTDTTTPAISPDRKVGVHLGHCIEVFAPLKIIECYFTWRLRDGTLASQGPFDLTTGKGTHIITGGSGKYFGASGEIDAVLGGFFPTTCNVPDTQTVNTYTFCLDKPFMTL